MPEQLVPGKPLYYATAVAPRRVCAPACSPRATWDGRRWSRGTRRTPTAWARSTPGPRRRVLTLYDPDRSQVVTPPRGRSAPGTPSCSKPTRRHRRRAGQEGGGAADPDRDGHLAHPGAAAPRRSRNDFPEAKWHQYEPAGGDQPARAPGSPSATDVDGPLSPRQGRRDPGARRRLPHRQAPAGFATPASSPPAASRDGREDEPALRRRAGADDHRHDGRPPPGAPVAPGRRGRAGSRREAGRQGRGRPGAARRRGTQRLGRRGGRATSRPHKGASLVVAGETQPPARPRPGARHQRGAGQRRQDGGVYSSRSRPSPSIRSSRSATLVADMEAGTVDAAPDPRRQPGLQRAGRRSTSPGRLAKVGLERPPGPVRGRDLGGVRLAPPRGARAGGLERRAGVRRHRDDPAALDRAALRRQVGPRAARRAAQVGHRSPGYDLVRETWKAAPHEGRLRDLLAHVGPRRRRRRDGGEGRRTVAVKRENLVATPARRRRRGPRAWS